MYSSTEVGAVREGAMADDTAGSAVSGGAKRRRRAYVSQTDVPGYSLEQALRVPQAIADNYGGGPVTPLQLASALDMSPSSGGFRGLSGASIAYGLTDGGSNAQSISITPLGKRIVKPLEEGDDTVAKREAVLQPRVVGEFLNKYNGSPLPRPDIARNVLESMGVPADKTESAFQMIVDSAEAVGLLREIKGKQYVDLVGVADPSKTDEPTHSPEDELDGTSSVDQTLPSPTTGHAPAATQQPDANRRVFITHGKDKDFIEPVKKLLGFGELVPVVSVDRQSVSKPVPDKVLDDMRSCGAAIIHVADEMKLLDAEANEHIIINPNVLIEIGAAMALYGRRFILLVKEGVELPSNLQGLYEVRYRGDSLDGEATIKLLEAINDIKNHPLPDRYKTEAQ